MKSHANRRVALVDTSADSVEEVERIVRQQRERWPFVRILLRADSRFAREALMAWCEQNRVDYVFGLARNTRLVAMIEGELDAAKAMGPSRAAARRWRPASPASPRRQIRPKARMPSATRTKPAMLAPRT